MANMKVAIVSFVFLVFAVLGVARLGKHLLFALSVAFIVMSNITVQVTTEVAPGVIISWAIIIYSMVYLITDLVIEFYGRTSAYQLAAANLGVQILLWVYVWLSMLVVPISDGNARVAYDTMGLLFGTTTRITIAAVIAAIGPFADIFATDKLRVILRRLGLGGAGAGSVLARAKVSTLLGELINTVLFFGIALAGTGAAVGTQVSIILTATLTKWTLAFADVPFLWAFLRYAGEPLDNSREHAGERLSA